MYVKYIRIWSGAFVIDPDQTFQISKSEIRIQTSRISQCWPGHDKIGRTWYRSIRASDIRCNFVRWIRRTFVGWSWIVLWPDIRSSPKWSHRGLILPLISRCIVYTACQYIIRRSPWNLIYRFHFSMQMHIFINASFWIWNWQNMYMKYSGCNIICGNNCPLKQ